MIDECKWMQDEVCVNEDCPACADYCPGYVKKADIEKALRGEYKMVNSAE